MKTLPIILPIITCIVLLSSCNNSPKKNQQLEEAKVEVPSDPNLLLATELMENADNDFSTQLAAAYFYSLVPEETIAMDSIHQQNIDVLHDGFHFSLNNVPLLVETIYTDVEVDQTSAGNSKNIDGVDYFFQPYNRGYAGSSQNIIYESDFLIPNITKTNYYHINQTELVYTYERYNYHFYYIDDEDHRFMFGADSLLETYHVDTTIYYMGANDTIKFDRYVSNDPLNPMFFHPEVQIHYHAPCKVKPNKQVGATANNRKVTVVENGHPLNNVEFRMALTPPDCTRMSESTLESDTFKVKLAKVYYLKNGVQFPIDTIAYFPEAL